MKAIIKAVRANAPETIGYGVEGRKAFSHGWSAAMDQVYAAIMATPGGAAVWTRICAELDAE